MKNKNKKTSKPTLSQEIAYIHQWQQDHEKQDNERFKITSDAISAIPTKEEISRIFKESMKEFFEQSGTLSIRIILLSGALVSAVVAIVAGLKTISGWVHLLK